MKEIRNEAVWRLYDDDTGLEDWQQVLLREAHAACEHAYAPYSEYRVDAALLMADGSVVRGANQENASFPVGTCAERAALYHAHSHHGDMAIRAVAVTTEFPASEPVAPCGLCRQALLESERRQDAPIQVLMTHPGGQVLVSDSVADLLPLAFRYKA